jgi:hypothetical protein
MDSVILNVYNNGTYYNPAWKHYGHKTNVVCDRCKTTQLKVCIGWNKYDLCMQCIDDVSRHSCRPDPRDMTLMVQSMFTEDRNMTYMSQGMYDRDLDYGSRTKMMQGNLR